MNLRKTLLLASLILVSCCGTQPPVASPNPKTLVSEGEGEGEGEGDVPPPKCTTDTDCSMPITCSADPTCAVPSFCEYARNPDFRDTDPPVADARGCALPPGSTANLCALCADECVFVLGSCSEDTECPLNFTCDTTNSVCVRSMCTDDCQCPTGQTCDARTASCVNG